MPRLVDFVGCGFIVELVCGLRVLCRLGWFGRLGLRIFGSELPTTVLGGDCGAFEGFWIRLAMVCSLRGIIDLHEAGLR